MFLVDGGKVTFTALADRYTRRKWAEVGFEAWDLAPHLNWTDFEVVDAGAAIEWSGDCRRTPAREQ